MTVRRWLWTGAVLVLLWASPGWAQSPRIIPVPPEVTPRWLPAPGSPQIYYAPNIPTDVFRYRGQYYFLWEGVWYVSRSVRGPWKRTQAPVAFRRLDPSLFKMARVPGGPGPGRGSRGLPGPGLPEGYEGPSAKGFTLPPPDLDDRFKPPPSFRGQVPRGPAPGVPPGGGSPGLEATPAPYYPLPGEEEAPVPPTPDPSGPGSDPRVPKAM
ncbi:MAG: hypothetical protein K6T55_03635 [Syntrophobacterales bacterium]|nr:hypothetical protein [Syntrophobacterales bacterium]